MNMPQQYRVWATQQQFEQTLAEIERLRAQVQHENGVVQSVVAAYDALEPDWTQAPEWATWYAIDANGAGTWYRDEPFICNASRYTSASYWDAVSDYAMTEKAPKLPLGIDWRLCIWQRPEAQ